MASLEITERNQAGELVATYLASSTTSTKRDGRVDIAASTEPKSITRSVLDAFLPAGYPQSVTSDYLEYQIYDSLQAFSSAIAGLLSSRAVLEGVGVGDATASPTAALLLSVLQDSTGRIATILFAHKLGTSLEPECKMYRLAADFFNDAAMILDCLSPALPKVSRVVLLSCSSILRALCGVAAGSSKASLSAHFATQGNLGELNAKDSSQETIISLMGMLAGSFVVARVSSQFATWACMIALLSIHLGMNYMAVRAVSMRTLNRQRANLVISNYIAQSSKPRTVLTPEQVSPRERIFERDGVLRLQGNGILGHCKVGVSLQQVLDSLQKASPVTGSYLGSSSNLQNLLDAYLTDDYVLWYDAASKRFLIVLKSTSTSTTQLMAWTHAILAAQKLQTRRLNQKLGFTEILDLLRETYQEVNIFKIDLLSKLEEAGWDIENGALETQSGCRIHVTK